jgi:hypothetical protein
MTLDEEVDFKLGMGNSTGEGSDRTGEWISGR